MSPTTRRRVVAALSTTTIAATATLALPLPAQAATTYSAFGGSAYGSTVRIGTAVTSGATSYVSICTTDRDAVRTNNTARLHLPGVGTIGAATTSVRSSSTTGSVSSTSRTSTASTSLLGGLITATSLASTATVTRTSTGYRTTGSTVLTGLRVAGKVVSTSPAANTTITIPRVATVRLNQQSTSVATGQHALSVNALRITLLKDNRLGLPVGTIVVGAAHATLQEPTYRRPYGSAYATRVDVAGAVQSGATAAISLPCGGSKGQTRTSNVAGVDLGPVLRTGALVTTVASTDTASKTSAVTTAKVSGARLLGGLVTFDAATAKATATRSGTSVSSSSAGTGVTGLKVNGKAIVVGTAENSRVEIAGVGTLVLRKVARSSTGIQVYAAELTLNTARAGLPSGTTVRIGLANAGVLNR